MTTNRKHRLWALFFLPVFVFAFSFFFDPVISKAASASTDGTFYAALADISGSMPEDAFVSGRSGIRELSHRLGASDSMSVITFGDAVTEIASFNGGDQANADNALQVLDTILPHDQTTKFYEALGFLQQRAAAAPQPIKRAVIMTDGVDVSDMTPETATSLMNGFYDNNIRIYGVLVESRQSTPETTAQFTNFCEKTGGAVEVVSGVDANAAYQNVISKMTSVNVIKEEQERFEDAYEETGETVPIEQWTAGIPEAPDSASSSSEAISFSEAPLPIKTGTDVDKDGNGILDEYENGGAEKTRPNALELIKPYLPVIIGIAAAVAAVIVLIILLSRRRSSGDGGFMTHGAGKGKRVVTESANEEAPQEEPKKKEKEKREKNKDKVEFFFSEKKDDE
ncbi:MAG: VWA domain-containing protein [Lachnospiraceae bacterium]|nr:VWA domain-containing protein [Lachnospiraceae bacterium]